MPGPLTDEEWKRLLDETDTFKLAIRGATAIEAEIDAGIAQLAQGPVPPELQRTRYEIRLAVAIAIGLIPQHDQPLFRAIAKLRNDFAHGKIRDLTDARARELADAAVPVLGIPTPEEVATLRSGLAVISPLDTLRFALMVARAWVRGAAGQLLEQRAEEQRILARHRAVPDSVIEALLTEADDS
jgi:hypothetical protein